LVPVGGVGAVLTLSGRQFAELETVPSEAEWFASLSNPNTRWACRNDVTSFMGFLGIQQGEDLRRVTRAHVLV